MSVIRPKPPDDPLHFDPRGSLAVAGGHPSPPGGTTARAHADTRPDTPVETPADVAAELLSEILAGFSATLAELRRSIMSTAEVVLPNRLLDDYTTPGRRSTSELSAILATARRLRESVDRVIVVGDGRAALAGQAVFESCAHPFHNELPRGERGGRPRISWIDSSADNDVVQGLLDLVAPAGSRPGRDLLAQWAVVATGPPASAERTAAAARLFAEPLMASVGGDRTLRAERFVTIAAPGGPLGELAAGLGGSATFELPAGRSAESCPFTAATLLPAAVAGIDVVRLLEGAVAMNRRFVEAPPELNPALGFAAVSVAAAECGCELVLAPTGRQLDSIGRWHARLEALTDPAAASARARSIAAAQVTAGRAVRVPVRALRPIRDRLVVPPLTGDVAAEDAGHSSPAFSDRTISDHSVADHAVGSRAEDAGGIVLPRVDEHAVGQLLQFVHLASLAAAMSR